MLGRFSLGLAGGQPLRFGAAYLLYAGGLLGASMANLPGCPSGSRTDRRRRRIGGIKL